MIVPSIIRRKFMDCEPHFKELEKRVQAAVFTFCNSHGFAYSGRLKTLDSLAEKLESGRYDKWTSLDDLFGCVVVVPTLRHEQQVIEFLQRTFAEHAIKPRGQTRKQPEAFRFDATRFVGRLRPISTVDMDSPLYSTCFEVQVRTAFEHAWSVTTHALAYKSNLINWKYLRLAAQLKAAVEQLDTLVVAYTAAAEPIIEHEWPELNAKQVVVERFEKMVADGSIATELAPKDWSRFADNLFALLRSSHNSSRPGLDVMVHRAMDIIEAEVGTLGRDGIPKSISLLQFSLGVLAQKQSIVPPLNKYVPLITEELEGFYPETKKYLSRFSF